VLNEVVGHETDEDLYPSSEDRHTKLVQSISEEFISAEGSQRAHRDRWERYYKHYRSYVARDPKDWRSRKFMPVTFYVIETVAPRMVAQMPIPKVNAVGAEDVEGAMRMEGALGWCFDQSGAFLQTVHGFKSALMYGTGILKTFHGERRARRFIFERPLLPITQQVPMPVPDPERGGAPMMDPDGNPLTQMQEMFLGTQEGEPVRRFEEAISYSGPACQSLDISNFFPAPGATSIDDAPYVIERVWRPRHWVQRQIDEGVYRVPDGMSVSDFWEVMDDPTHERLTSIGLDGGHGADTSRKLVEIWERWDAERGTVTHILAGRIVVRVTRNPFSHGEFPYARIVDHLPPQGEFWGIGEIEPIEGLQDAFNAMTNSRFDQITLALMAPFLVDEAALQDRRELRMSPGALLRVKNNWGLPLEQIIQKVHFDDVPTSSFEETAQLMDMMERVSGVSAYQTGTDSTGLNDTATGVAIISDQGNQRFSHKLKIAELTGLRTLARHFGTNLQQFMPDEMRVRVFNPAPGQDPFDLLRPEELQGAFDYDIESESSAVTETVRKDQDLTLFNMFANDPYVNQRAIREKVLRTFGVKDVETYLGPAMPAAGMGMPGLPGMPMDPMAAQGLPPAAPPLEMGAPV